MMTSTWMALNRKALPIGVDIGHSGIKMVQLAQTDSRMKVLSVGRVPIARLASMDGSEQRRSIIAAIKQLLARGGFKGRRAVSALSGDELRITSLRLAETETLQANKALYKEAAQRFDMDPQRDVISYILAGSVRQDDAVKDEFIVLAADAATITSHISLLEEAGLQPVGIDAAPCALFRSFERSMRRETDRQRTIIYMDIGHRYTTVVFGRDGEICLIKQMPFGTVRFDEEIAAKLDIAPAEAEALRLKLQRSEDVDSVTHPLVTDVLTSTAEQLAHELSLCLRYHTVTFRGKRVEQAVVAGGGAREQIVLDVLRRHLSIAVAVVDPLRGFDVASQQHDPSVDLALAVGLSLKGQKLPAAYDKTAQVPCEPVLEGERP